MSLSAGMSPVTAVAFHPSNTWYHFISAADREPFYEPDGSVVLWRITEDFSL
jgi:hypothetical protein